MKLPRKEQLARVSTVIAARGTAAVAAIRDMGNWLASPSGMAALTGCQTAVSVLSWLGH
ncbi:hypothetical protein [Streptomyces sp. enrichment culture]|uniref:hypothetical protein n=1 Tax=Streptomyces sp. enrichment culture TaxID=1795815 RepID=UPI003F555F79